LRSSSAGPLAVAFVALSFVAFSGVRRGERRRADLAGDPDDCGREVLWFGPLSGIWCRSA